MARIKKYSPEQKLSSFQTFILDENPNSDYFRITEFKDTFTGGKNGFLIEGSEYLKESTEIKIELLDVNGDPIYYEPGNGIPEYYEGISKLIAVYIYEDTPIGLGKITILGELKEFDDSGVKREVPEQWKGTYNVKWERTFQVNKNLSNEDKVRFYRRPQVQIDEIVKPIFSKTPNTITQTGTIDGTPLIPNNGSKLSNFSLPTSYRVTTTNDTYWTGSVIGQTLNVPSLNYTPIITDVVSKTELVVDPPYAPNDVVSSFSGQDYSVDFVYIEGAGDLATALTGSFAKINITDMKTFVGDAARIKVFRRSQSQLSDYEFVQDIQLESTELLKDIETTSTNEEVYGNFTDRLIDEYWVTSSNDITVDFNQTFLYNSAELSSTNTQFFFTTQSLSISSGVEYNLSFNVRKENNTSTDDYIKVFLSGSLNGTPKSQTISTINSSNSVLQKTNSNENIIADEFDEARLYFEIKGSNWYVNSVSLKAAQETAFSPDEITFIQQVPKTLPSETFDYRFEFYDINNNYIPVLVDETKTFTGGNLNLFEKSIELVPDQLYFAFDSASNPLPPKIINFEVNSTLITGSINYSSQSFDFFGNEISASEYDGGQYPGLLQDRDTDNPFLTVSDFTGSRDDLTIQYVRYVAEVEGVTDSVIITRVQDGKGGVNFEIRPFRGTIIKNKQDKDLEVQAIRIDGENEIFLRGDMPQSDFSLAKLRVQSGSEYILLSEASSSEFIRGLSAGTTGSGEIDYNVQVNGEAIDEALTLYLMDGPTSQSILTSLLLTDLLDGLGSGFVEFSAEQFSLRPRLDTSYNPVTASVTASFQKRGEVEGFISSSLVVTPSASIDNIFNTHYYMFYETGAFDSRISVTATDLLDNPVSSGIPGQSVPFYEALETKQLTFNFTYTEDITSASVSVDKTFYIVPEGKPGDDAILVDIEPRIVQLNANQRGEVYDYTPLDTELSVKQGRLDLRYDSTQQAGTFNIANITPINIFVGSAGPYGDISASISGFSNMPNTLLSGSIKYDLEIHPFFTASYFTQSIIQKVTKAVDGAAGIELFINPLSVNLTGDESGNVSDFTLGNTILVVKQGDEYLTLSDTNTPGTFTASLNTKGIQPTLISSSANFTDGTYGDDTLIIDGFNQMPLLTASVDYNVTIHPFSLSNGQASGSTTLTRTQIFTKTLEGKKARTVKLNASSLVVVYDGNDIVVSPPGAITLEAVATGLTGSGYYQYFKDGFAYSLIDTDPDFTISSGDTVGSGETSTWRVEVRDGAATKPVVVSDEITIAGIKNGGDAYSIQLSNEAVSVPVEVDGTVDFTNTGTTIRAYKGNTELNHVSTYSSETIDGNGDPVGTFGEFSASVESVSAYITQTNIPTGNPAVVGNISGWTNPLTNTTGEVVYKIDLENGRSTFFKTQSFSVSLEGSVGPGIVFRGEYDNTIDYQYSVANGRRDAVIYDKNGDGTPETYYMSKQDNGPLSTVVAPEGDTDSGDYWAELGTEDLFVAAEIGIFGESFVRNTINIGEPPAGNPNANIALVGGTDEPYMAIGQTGIQGFQQPGVFIGLTNDGGPNGTSGTFGIMSLVGEPDGVTGEYNSMEWDGETLTIRGAIRQTSEGVFEGRILGLWDDLSASFPLKAKDIVTNAGQTWVCILAHNKAVNNEPGDGVDTTTYWELAAAAGTSGTAGTAGTGGSSGTAGSGGSSGTAGSGGTSGADGPAGGSGAGIVYRGVYDSGTIYYQTAQRTDVVKGSDGSYYIVDNESDSGTSNWDNPVGGSDWTSFGAEFSSVATDILFAQDVYADRTVNIGSDGSSPVIALNADSANSNANPRIQIGQDIDAGAGFLDDGIYFGYTGGNPVLSIVTGSTYFFYESGSIQLSDASFVGSGSIIEGSSIRVGRNLNVSPTASNAYNFTVSETGILSASAAFIQGTVAADGGNIGNWIIEEEDGGEGGQLRTENSEIIFDPNIPEIQMYSGSLKRLFLGNRGQLQDIAGSGDTLSWTSPEPKIPTGNHTSTDAFGTTKNIYTDITDTTSLTQGTYTISGISWPALTVKGTNFSTVAAGEQSYPNYDPSFAGEQHGGFFQQNQPKQASVQLYLELVDTTNGNAVLDSELLGSTSAKGDFTVASNAYYWIADDGTFGGIESVIGTTEITLFDGTIKLAKDIEIGDSVLTWDTNEDSFIGVEVSHILTRNVSELYKIVVDGLEITVSDSHGFWLGTNHKAYAKDLSVGDTIYIKTDNSIELKSIESVELIESDEMVYTFTVPNTHNYVSNDIISHNALLEGELTWVRSSFLPASQTASDGTLSAGSGVEKTFTLNTTSTAVAARFRLRIISYPGASSTTNASGTSTTTLYHNSLDYNQTNNAGVEIYFASTPIDSAVTVEKQNNYVEVQPGGIQVVTSEDVYIQMRRKDSITNTTAADANIFSVVSGSSTFKAASNPYTTAIQSDGHIVPLQDEKWDLGSSTYNWRNVLTQQINDANVSDFADRLVGAMCSFAGRNTNGSVSITNPQFNIASISRNNDGGGQYYRVTFDDAPSQSIPFVMSYGRLDVANSDDVANNEFVMAMGAKPVNTLAYVDINFKDNDTNTDVDPRKAYLIMVGSDGIAVTQTS